MTHILTSNGLTATFKPNGEYVEITQTRRQEVQIRVEECYNEWHGLSRPTGEIRTQVITGESWTEVTRKKARQIWADLISQGWQLA
jgi:hypothetical protein